MITAKNSVVLCVSSVKLCVRKQLHREKTREPQSCTEKKYNSVILCVSSVKLCVRKSITQRKK